jgi:hypothetical protein
MIASGVGYLLLHNTIVQAAAVPLPLVLIWSHQWGVTRGRRND